MRILHLQGVFLKLTQPHTTSPNLTQPHSTSHNLTQPHPKVSLVDCWSYQSFVAFNIVRWARKFFYLFYMRQIPSFSNEFNAAVNNCCLQCKFLNFWIFLSFGIFQTVFWPCSRLYFGLKFFYNFL